MRPGLTDKRFKYWEYLLCYVDDVLSVSHDPECTMKGIQRKFTLKGGKYEKPDNYLGAVLSQIDNDQGNPCWTMSSGKYCDAFIKNVEEYLASKGL